ESEAQEEIAPGDGKYCLEPLPKAPLQTQHLGYFGQPSKFPWIHFSTTYEECDYYMTTTHQISFQNPPLGQSMFPVHVQGRKIALIMHPVYMEYINQYQSDFQGPGWNQVLKLDRDKSSQGIKRVTRTQLHPDRVEGHRSWLADHYASTSEAELAEAGDAFLGGKSAAKSDRDTVTRISYLLPPQSLEERVKAKYPSSTFRVFTAKLQAETASKQFFQDCGTQPRVCRGDAHHRGYEKALGRGSQAPTETQTTTRTSYMPLFSERVNLCKPKVNSIECEANTLSLLSRGKYSGTKERLSHYQIQ
ncbi:hypothetical protein EI555_002625, partial [Monodon monoceros]